MLAECLYTYFFIDPFAIMLFRIIVMSDNNRDDRARETRVKFDGMIWSTSGDLYYCNTNRVAATAY